MVYLGIASQVAAARYRSDIKVRENMSQCGVYTESFGETTVSPSYDMFYAIVNRETLFS